MNDMTKIAWADVPKGVIINGILYRPETTAHKFKCHACDYLLSGKCNGVKPCMAFGENLHLRYVGKVVGLFVSKTKRYENKESVASK